MIKKEIMIFFFLLLLAAACAGTSGSRDRALVYLADSKVKEIPVSSPEQGKMVIENQVRFLKLLFTQSRDPYYGRPKWSEKCLAENRVGELTDKQGVLESVSELYLDRDSNPGVCSGTKYTRRLIYCPSGKFVYSLTTPVQGQVTVNGTDLCAAKSL